MGHGRADLVVIGQVPGADVDAETKLSARKFNDHAQIAAAAQGQRHGIAHCNFAGDFARYGNDIAAVFIGVEDVIFSDRVD